MAEIADSQLSEEGVAKVQRWRLSLKKKILHRSPILLADSG
jgi:hypothetical protein